MVLNTAAESSSREATISKSSPVVLRRRINVKRGYIIVGVRKSSIVLGNRHGVSFIVLIIVGVYGPDWNIDTGKPSGSGTLYNDGKRWLQKRESKNKKKNRCAFFGPWSERKQ